MKVRVLGLGMYGAHISTALIADGHAVECHEIADRVFAAASGAIPARVHRGPHYPRSGLTRAACQEHNAEFMDVYGDFTHGIPVNVYAIAEHDSLMDFSTYRQVLRSEIEFITVERPKELGLRNVEGAILTGERHILVDRLREHFASVLDGHISFGVAPGVVDDPSWDISVDATFCANESAGIDRYEPCLTVLMEGPVDRAVTIVDGKFGSLYAWDETQCLSSLTSAEYTPFCRCATWQEARSFLDNLSSQDIERRAWAMFSQMAEFYPRIRDEYKIVDYRTAIRAMPRSAADARLVDVARVGKRAIRIRAGKLDAIFQAERMVKAMIADIAKEQGLPCAA